MFSELMSIESFCQDDFCFPLFTSTTLAVFWAKNTHYHIAFKCRFVSVVQLCKVSTAAWQLPIFGPLRQSVYYCSVFRITQPVC